MDPETSSANLLKRLGVAFEATLPVREPFRATASSVSYDLSLRHPGLEGAQKAAYPADLQELESHGYIRYQHREPMAMFDLTTRGWRAYQELKRGEGTLAESVVSEAKLYLDVSGFRERHQQAHEAWSHAAARLWEADPDSTLTEIGHSCREATVYFGESCLTLANVPKPWPEAGKTKDRIERTLKLRVPSPSRRRLLTKMFAYWCELVEFSHRQDHGAERSTKHLSLDDARVLVSHALLAMTEIDRASFGP